MAPTTETTRQFLFNMRLREYTFDEAIEAMKVLDTLPNGNSNQINWVRSDTKKRVTIGYTK
jgi:hypothetical protein